MYYLFNFLFFLPALFQLIVGYLVFKKRIKFSFSLVSVISVLSLAVIVIALFLRINYGARLVDNHDGLWVVGLAALSGFGFTILLLIILIQWLIMKYWKPTVAKK